MPNRIRSTRIRRGRTKRGVRYAAVQKQSREETRDQRLLRRVSSKGFAEDDWE